MPPGVYLIDKAGKYIESSNPLYVNISTMPTVIVEATDLDIRALVYTGDSITAHQGGTWSVNIGTIPTVTVTATDLDIRNLIKTQDEVYSILKTDANAAYDARDRSWTITETVPVSGTFWQTTQPVSGNFYPVTQPVSGTFWQTTQPVSGTFWQTTQPVSGTVTCISHDENMIHEGKMFSTSYLFTAVTDNDYARLRIINDANHELHFSFAVETEAKVYIKFYEDTTYTVDGTEVDSFNSKRSSGNTTGATVYHTPTIDNIGTEIRTGLQGTAGKFVEAGGADGSKTERMLNVSTDYLIAVQNKGGAAKDIVIRIRFGEDT